MHSGSKRCAGCVGKQESASASVLGGGSSSGAVVVRVRRLEEVLGFALECLGQRLAAKSLLRESRAHELGGVAIRQELHR